MAPAMSPAKVPAKTRPECIAARPPIAPVIPIGTSTKAATRSASGIQLNDGDSPSTPSTMATTARIAPPRRPSSSTVVFIEPPTYLTGGDRKLLLSRIGPDETDQDAHQEQEEENFEPERHTTQPARAPGPLTTSLAVSGVRYQLPTALVA